MTLCRGCGAEIIFVKLDTGKIIPIDPEPDNEAGNICAAAFPGREHWAGFTMAAWRMIPDGWQRYRTHFATCPKASQFRKKKPTVKGETG